MGSQTLEILRQGVWASLTGGWFYDPHQNIFCNTVHLYIWLFLLCAPFITYLYFPKTFTTWGVYCFTTALTITVLKIINMALHILYDKAQTLSDSNLKKPLKGIRESKGEDDCGIEMQVLGADMPSQNSAEQPINEASGANSIISIDCQDHVTSTIDLKVDVHRKNSSESSDSIGMGLPGGSSSYRTEIGKTNNHRRSLKTKSKSEERPSKNPAISEEMGFHENERKIYEIHSPLQVIDGCSESNKIMRMEDKRNSCLERQSSFDVSEASVLELSLARQQICICCDIDVDNFSEVICKRDNHKPSKLQRHRSSESNDDRHRRSRNLFLNHREQQSGNDIRNPLQSLASDLYLESNYAKSDLGIENIENNNSKIYLLQQPKPMRKDSSSTMSALQLPVASAQSNNARKRRHSNTGCKPIVNQAACVRRIKSTALEISCPQPSVSNLSPHPNSAEAISGQQIKNPQSAMLPPPSKCLVRNPHLNLCPKLSSLGNNSSGIITEPVYPIAEQADEKSLNEAFIFSGELDSESENADKLASSSRKRCSTTESESDLERPRTQSTDSETDNNGSRSPLLNKISRYGDKYKNTSDDVKQKIVASVSNFADVANGNNLASRYKNGDSGCPSSDCEQTSASSKDMLLSKDKSGEHSFKRWSGYSEKDVKENIAPDEDATSSENFQKEDESMGRKCIKDAKHLGAIPKTSTKKDDLSDYVPPKRPLGAIPKSTSRTSSSASSRSFSAESFSNEIYKPYKDQWLVVGPGHCVQPGLNTSCMHADVLFSNYPRRTFIDPNYRFQPKLRRSSENTRRNKDIEHGGTKLEEISTTLEFGSDDLQNTGNGTLSIQGLMNEHYSFENAITSEQRPSTGQILNISHVEFNDSVCCDYWRPCSLAAEKPMQPKRFYKYRLNFFGRRELKISMDRLQLLALFDRDLQWFHVVLAIFLSAAVCLLGSTILQMGFYKDIFAFIFCVVIAGSQYSLLKSVQPDAASPIHGFNKTVAYSRPIYFCLCSGLLVLSHHLALELNSNNAWNSQQKEIQIFGIPFSPEAFLSALTKIMSIVLLLFPVFFSLGLFPQINTFCMYILEQIDMHIFGGSAASSLSASMICVFKSMIAVCILYGPAYGGLIEQKGTQHVLFSIFCALLIPISYHLSRTASDFTHIWSIIKSSLISYPEDEDEEVNEPSNTNTSESKEKSDTSKQQQEENTEVDDNEDTKEDTTCSDKNDNTGDEEQSPEIESPDPLPKKLQQTVNTRLKNDLVVSSVLALIIFGLHCSTVFTVLQPDLNIVLYSIAGILGFFLHYVLPQMRKHLPWLCFSRPILRQNEFGRFEVSEAAKIMWFEVVYVCLCFLERNVLYPLIFISALTADSSQVVQKFGIPVGVGIISMCGLKCVRSAYSDVANQYLILIFAVLLFKIDFTYASETFLVDYFVVSIIFRKSCDFLLKLQFIVTYIAPWQITWGSAFHAFAQPFSVPHSAMLFMQAGISAILSTPLNPFLGSAIFLTSYARPIKFWERDYNTRRIDHSNTRLSSQLERDLGADDNNLNSIFYEHLTRSLQHSLCGDLLLGRWGTVNQGDCFVLASDYLNCLVHIIELGNGLCTFQMRGLEFRGTYCQQREVEAISEGVEDNDGCCCCTPGHLPRMLSANAMFSTRWLAWQVVAAQYVLEGYSISENLATATLQVFEFRKVLISYYVKSIIYYVTRNSKLDEWLASETIQEALANTLNRQFVDLDPIFNYNLDEDFDFRALGITRTSFCSVYMSWIQFCYTKKKFKERSSSKEEEGGEGESRNNGDSQSRERNSHSNSANNVNTNAENSGAGDKSSPKLKDKIKKTATSKNDESGNNSLKNSSITKDSSLVSLCLALGLLARRTLATASHSSLSGVEFFLHGLHALFKGDFRITSPRDEWVFADMELLHGVVAPAVKMALKLHQDHFSSPDEYLDPAVLYDAITSHSKDLVISHEADPMWRSAVLKGAPNLLALRHVMEDGSDEYRIIRLTKRFLNFRVIKLNRECVRGLWAGQQQELIYLRNRNPERGSIQNAKQALRNIINSSCDQPIGYPIYVSPLTTSYAETNEQLCRIIGGSITLDAIRSTVLDCWNHIRQRCREGCSSGSGGLDCDVTNEVPGVYFSPAAVNNTSSTLPYGSQSLSCAGTRGSLASMNKPTSSTLIAGFLNRERDQERENVRERSSKKNVQSRSERERRATLPIASSAVSESTKDFVSFKEGMGITNSGLRHVDVPDATSHPTKMFCSSGNLGAEGLKGISGDTPKRSSSEQPGTSHEKDEFAPMESMYSLIELNKKVIIVDGTEIYDCLDLGRRIDVVWPNERMRACGGRSSWKDWMPKEGMVGYVVHYWQPNHPDQRFRSNVNRTLYLVEIGERFVPVGESGIREYNQIAHTAFSRSYPSTAAICSNTSGTTDASLVSDIPISTRKTEVEEYSNPKENIDYSNCDSNNQTDISFNDDHIYEDENDNAETESSGSLSSAPNIANSPTFNQDFETEQQSELQEVSIGSQNTKFTEKETS